MNSKKIIIFSLLLILLLAPISFAEDGDYTIPRATKDIIVKDDGSTVITEEIVQDIEGRVNGVYRDIPVDSYQSITNISVETPGYYNTVEVIEYQGVTKIKVWLYKDEAKTRKIYDDEVTVIYHYTFNKGVKIYNDIAELQYMSWGNQWDSSVDELTTTIYLPGDDPNLEYWNNPSDDVVSSEWVDSSTLKTVAKDIRAHDTLEQRILMPKSYFKSTENAKVIDMDAKAQIEQDQIKYQQDRDNKGLLSGILSGIMGIFMIIPLGIYGLFGREPKIDYKAEYEYDLPTDSSPVEVNNIVIGDVGRADENAIYATILDLIDRGYYKIMTSNDEDTIIRLNNEISQLKPYEKYLVNYLSKFQINGDISLKSIGEVGTPSEFSDFKINFFKMINQEVPDSLVDRYFDNKGYKIFRKFTIISLVLSIILMFVSTLYDFIKPYDIIIITLAIILLIESILMVFLPNTFAGRWTPEGRTYHDKWNNFKKYIKDFSLIKERPPASIQVWGKYLVYAAALGCADEASKNMKKYFSVAGVGSDYIDQNNVVLFAYYGGYDHMNSSFVALQPSDSGSDGIGSVGGGGFGGGGGGTF